MPSKSAGPLASAGGAVRRARTVLCALVGLALLAPGAEAALKKYALEMNAIIESANVSPNPTYIIAALAPELGSRVVIDDSGPFPVLKKLAELQDRASTTDVPELGGFIFTSNNQVAGPGGGEFTGTGSTETTIVWGLITGWTITGTQWCHAAPAFVCGVASMIQDESIDPVLRSPFYDLGTWTFHGTGWTSTPYVQQNSFVDPGPPSGDGNLQQVYRGTLVLDGTVPALPLVGTAILGASVILGGWRALRRRRD